LLGVEEKLWDFCGGHWGATQSTHSLFCLISARNVPVGEASVIVAVSAEHRKDTLDAVAYGIDTLKARVPIWKKVRSLRRASPLAAVIVALIL
jgi:hypothetical protein